MTFVALFTSWEFWLINSLTFLAGYILRGMFQNMNEAYPIACQRLHADEYGVQLIGLQAEGRRLQEQVDALQVMNDDLQDQINALDDPEGVDPDNLLPELLRRGTEQRPE